MDKEELIKMGLTSEQADKVVASHKKELDGKYIPKDRFDEVNGKLKTANETIQNRDSQIAKLKEFEGTNEQLKAEVAKLEKANQEEKDTHQKEMQKIQKQQKVKDLIGKQEKVPYSVDEVLSALDMEKIQITDAGVVGFKEQYEKLGSDKPHWFKTTQPQPSNQMFGFNFKGSEPEGKDDSGGDGGNTLNKAQMFGKALAQAGNSGDTTKKATDFFFGSE